MGVCGLAAGVRLVLRWGVGGVVAVGAGWVAGEAKRSLKAKPLKTKAESRKRVLQMWQRHRES